MGTAGLFSGSGGGANPAGWLRMLRAGGPARVSSGYAGSRGRCGRRTGWRRVVFTAADGLPRVETRGAGRGGQRILSEPFVGADASQLRFDDAREFVFGVWSLTALLTAPPVAVPSVKSLSVRVA